MALLVFAPHFSPHLFWHIFFPCGTVIQQSWNTATEQKRLLKTILIPNLLLTGYLQQRKSTDYFLFLSLFLRDKHRRNTDSCKKQCPVFYMLFSWPRLISNTSSLMGTDLVQITIDLIVVQLPDQSFSYQLGANLIPSPSVCMLNYTCAVTKPDMCPKAASLLAECVHECSSLSPVY